MWSLITYPVDASWTLGSFHAKVSRMPISSAIVEPYIITDGSKFKLSDFDPDDKGDFKNKDDAQELLALGLKRISELQERLYAQNKWGVLLIFQAMDAAGKDGAIKHVMSGVNPQGCQVYSFKAPSAEELDHDFLWRAAIRLPERGRIGIFNRSYYEETLVVRVHPEYLAAQRLPESCIPKDIWEQRFQDINNFEKYLSNNGFLIRKFFLHLSKKEQKKRFLSRLDEPEKHWKFAVGDLDARDRWDEYQHAYEQTIRNTSSSHAPWIIAPADNKWYTRLIIAGAIISALESLNSQFPTITPEDLTKLQAARKRLQDER